MSNPWIYEEKRQAALAWLGDRYLCAKQQGRLRKRRAS